MKQFYKVFKILILYTGFLFSAANAFSQWNPDHSIGTVTGNYNFSYNQTPDQLVEINLPLYTTGTALTYQWEQSPDLGFPSNTTTVIGTQSSYSFSTPLAQSGYYRRKASRSTTDFVYSNIVRISVVSVNWEDFNYIREHDILKSGVADWKTVDQLPIGDKLQTTTYLDGLGRPLQKVSRETATPASASSLWGDVVQFSTYDVYGREPLQYLPYTTTAQSGKYKTSTSNDVSTYYSNIYGETSPYSNITYDNSPLKRVVKVKSAGASWAAGAGNSASYDLNDATENVQIFTIGYNSGDAPVSLGAYPANTLYKTKHTDENGKQVIEYTNKSGQVILTKTQIDDVPSAAHGGWICVYSVYDDFGLLRYRLQPEAVKFLAANSWTFSATGGQQVLNELCFRYDYDDKGRNILKKAPGAKELRMIYDGRDRVVFMQDGNQSLKSTPEWTANLYDELDRPVITTLYKTTKTVSTLQSDVDNSATLTTVTIANPAAPVANLVLDARQTNNPLYEAQNSIEFTGGFVSPDNDYFEAQINATATQSITVTSAVYKDPIAPADITNPAVCTIVKYQFYDDYSYQTAKSFDNNFDNTTAYSNSTAGVIPIATTKRTTSFPTGSMVRVLGTNTFLTSTEFYDEKGRHIQTIEDNIKSGKDVTTMQYHWDGRLLSTHSKHTTANSGYANFGIVTKNIFDKIGRVTSVQKNYGGNGFKTIASYDFDDVGRLKTKHLDPGYTGSGKNELEGLTYAYNIHNNITGINQDYAKKTAGKYDKWGNFFGLYLGYDNKDLVFTNKQLDGHVTGLLWNTMGDDAQRKYDYTYDNAGRLTSAVFKERQTTGAAWDNSKMDFSVSGSSSGKITYDLNGNLLSMLQKGVLPGNTAPINVDNLAYTYGSYTNGVYSQYSNKLLKVTDNGTAGNANGSFGDFKDGTNGTADDYVYDNNGNLVIDLNKNAKDLNNVAGANGIRYNFLDKPEEIRISGKGTIKIVYDAEGNKLQKTYTPENGTAVTTTYINQYVYQGDALQYINFEEGRIRLMQSVSWNNGYDGASIDGNMTLPNGKKGVYDYFIRDYQENVRMILTEETHSGVNQCTMETARATNEEPVFGQTGAGNEVAATRFAVSSIPGQSTGGGWQNSGIGGSVSRVGNLAVKKTGPNVLLKVMAGDVVNASTQYFYKNPVVNQTGNNLTSNVLNTLVMAISGSSATNSVTKGATTNISNNLNATPPFVSKTAPDAANASGDNPKAYLTILFFDERFNYVGEGSDYRRVTNAGDNNASLTLANNKAPKNGYALVYVSNESDEPVYFDNLQVSHNRGRIIEENHYYAFGLKIAGISSTKLPDPNEGNINNKHLYNDKELIDEADLNWYDYGFRNYDPQIGRFPQLDPLTWDYPELTNYQYAGNEPIANVDLDGLEPWNILQTVTVTGHATKTVASVGNGLAKGLSIASIGVSAAKIATTAITLRGTADALKNASSLGIYDIWGGNHLDEYKTIEEKQAYLQGRVNGDALAIAMGASEMKVGGGIALTTGFETVGVGALAGGAIALHGAGSAGVATADMAAVLKQLYQLNANATATASESAKPNNGETSATRKGREVHDQYNPGGNYRVNRKLNRLQNGKIPDAVDFKNKIVRELKPNNSRAFREGTEQVLKYAQQLKKQFGGTWKTVVDTYDVLPNGTIRYNYGIPK